MRGDIQCLAMDAFGNLSRVEMVVCIIAATLGMVADFLSPQSWSVV